MPAPPRRPTIDHELAAARATLDALDDALVDALRARVACVASLWRAKHAARVPLRDRARERAVLARARARATAPLTPAEAARFVALALELTRAAAARALEPAGAQGRKRTPSSSPARKRPKV